MLTTPSSLRWNLNPHTSLTKSLTVSGRSVPRGSKVSPGLLPVLNPTSLHHPPRRFPSLACAPVAAMLLAAGLQSAGAQQWQWYPPVNYDRGTNPKVAVVDVQGGGGGGLEVHQAVNPPLSLLPYALWARQGDYVDGGPFSNSYQYDVGAHPTVTYAWVPGIPVPPGALQNSFEPIFIEMHQANVGVSELMCRLTDPSGTRLNAHPAIDTGEMGFNPSIASDGVSTVVQVHQALNGTGPLWYRVGKVNRAQTAPYAVSLSWSNPSLQYDMGANPCVTFLEDGTHVLEVHQATAGGTAPLWYRIGTLTGTSIVWENSVLYGYGSTPSVSPTMPSGSYDDIPSGDILEVHGHAGVDTGLYYQLASTASGPSPGSLRLNFGPASLYGYGLTPSLAQGVGSGVPNQEGILSISNVEVHQNGNALQTQVWGRDYLYGVMPK